MMRGSPSAEKGRKLYVGDLLGSVRKDEITREFKKFGELKDVWVARNPPGFAFVEFTKAVDAERAVRALDGMNVCGSRIRVEFARVSNTGKSRKPGNSMAMSGNGPRRSMSPILGPRGLGGGLRRPRTPPFSPPRRGPMSPPRGRSPFRRGRTPPPPPPVPGRGYHPYDALPPMYHPDPAFPYLPGYPMMPFIPPEELLRTLQRGRSPLGPMPPRVRSPMGRRRSRSPFGRGRDRSPMRRSDDYFSGGPVGGPRERMSPLPRAYRGSGRISPQGGSSRNGPSRGRSRDRNRRRSPPPIHGRRGR